jgi:predicted DNA-binding transcriptional regulator
MDGQMINKPEWLKHGALVKVQHWYGLVEDVAVSDQHVMVLVKSPKGIWRNQRDASEWLEYVEEQITPATPDEMEKEITAHAERIQRMLADLNEFREVILNGQLVKE